MSGHFPEGVSRECAVGIAERFRFLQKKRNFVARKFSCDMSPIFIILLAIFNR